MNSPGSSAGNSSRRRFATTSWSVVIAAGQESSPQQHIALEALCGSYWYPLYAWLRKHHNRVEAEDITQAFFVELLEKNRLEVADPQRGRFRSFLLTSLSRFRSNWVRDQRTLKRGGGETVISIDFARANQQFDNEPADQATPEKVFERSWALTLLEQALNELESSYASSGKQVLFGELQRYLNQQSAVPYAEVACRLDMTTEALRVAVHRMRKQYGELVRNEIARTVATPDQVDDELRDLFGVFDSD